MATHAKWLRMSYVSCESYDMKERTIVRADEARRRLRELLNEVNAGGVVEIRRYDTPEAILVSPDWYKRALEALEKEK